MPTYFVYVPATTRPSLPWATQDRKGNLGKLRGKPFLGTARDTGLALGWVSGAITVLARTGADKMATAILYRVRERHAGGC